MKALIIDDEKDICLLLDYQLKKVGVTSLSAHSLSEGLKLFNPSEHSLVFLDINLPDGKGLDIIPDLKAQNEDINIVVISAYDIKSEERKAYEEGTFQFLGKPFTNKMVSDIVKEIQLN